MPKHSSETCVQAKVKSIAGARIQKGGHRRHKRTDQATAGTFGMRNYFLYLSLPHSHEFGLCFYLSFERAIVQHFARFSIVFTDFQRRGNVPIFRTLSQNYYPRKSTNNDSIISQRTIRWRCLPCHYHHLTLDHAHRVEYDCYVYSSDQRAILILIFRSAEKNPKMVNELLLISFSPNNPVFLFSAGQENG